MIIDTQALRDLLRSLQRFEYRHIALTGASGSGKTTILTKDEQSVVGMKKENIGFSVSGATRPKRKGEVHGKDYYFLDPIVFANTRFLETNEYDGNSKLYGTLYSEAYRIMITEKKSMALDVDINGGKRLKEIFKSDLLWVNLRVPIPTLFTRLKKRQAETGETDAQIDSRIITAEKEKKMIEDKIYLPDMIIDYDDSIRPAEIANEILIHAHHSIPLLQY